MFRAESMVSRIEEPESEAAGHEQGLAALLCAEPWPTVMSAGAALLSACALFGDFPASWVLSWLGLAAMAHGARISVERASRAASRPLEWGLRLQPVTLGTLGIGLTWGALAIGVAAGTGSGSEAFIYAMAMSIMAGAAVTCRDSIRAADAVICPISAALALASWWVGDLSHVALGALAVVFGTAMSILGRHLDRATAEADALRRERGQLMAELSEGARQLGDANAEIEHANQRLDAAQNDLVRAHADAEAASKAKSEFLANMSHELRTPLNAIIGFAEVIERETFGPTVPRYREYASDIHGSGQHLLQVINDILDLAKVEAGQMLLHEARLDAALVMQGCVRLIKPRAAKSNVRIYTAFDPNLPVLLADEARLRQIALNLLSNAVKFTKAGGRVSISTGIDLAGGIAIAVTDTGIGMTEDDIRIALEPFRQVTSSLSRSNEGTGLGLPLTKTLVELHGGRLDITSVPGRGTTVTVSFPPSRSLAQPAEAAVQAG